MNCRDARDMGDSVLSEELLTETNHDILRHLEDEIDAQLAADRRDILRHLAIVHHRGPRDHRQLPGLHSTETKDEFLVQAVGKKLLVLAAGQVLERQHGQSDRPRGWRSAMIGAAEHRVRDRRERHDESGHD